MVLHFKNIFESTGKCEDLVTMAPGNVQLSTNGTLTLATFSCDVGFTLSGGYTSECSSDGTWTTTGSYPSCCMVTCFIHKCVCVCFFAFLYSVCSSHKCKLMPIR